MKSFKNHTSLIIALLGILFSIQVFTIVQRAVESYQNNLLKNYSIVVVSDKALDTKTLQSNNPLAKEFTLITPDHVIKKLNTSMSKTNLELLRITLPKFYKLTLSHYPSPKELESLKKNLMSEEGVRKIETFEKANTNTYK